MSKSLACLTLCPVKPLVYAMVLLASACSRSRGAEEAPPPAVMVPPAASSVTAPAKKPAETLERFLATVRTALETRDVATLARYAAPGGIRFDPYAFIAPEPTVVLTPNELRGALTDPTLRKFGAYDGSGEPIVMTFAEYFDKFVRIPDLEHAQRAVDSTIGSGNTPSNLKQVFPDASFVEFHHAGSDPKYEGMDWQSVRVVFRRDGDHFRILAIIHDQWTI